MNILSEIKSDVNAIALLKDWLGEGLDAVEPDVSEKRASICVDCPFNSPGNWWDKVKSLMADEIRRQMRLKNLLEITTPLDDQLGTCRICSCNLPLKVHVPVKHLKAHTLEEHRQAFPRFCWVKKEVEAA